MLVSIKLVLDGFLLSFSLVELLLSAVQLFLKFGFLLNLDFESDRIILNLSLRFLKLISQFGNLLHGFLFNSRFGLGLQKSEIILLFLELNQS
jgi:hypothetical protein